MPRVRTARRIVMDVGLRVAEARKLRGVTQEELATSVGVTPRHIQRIEGGRVDLPVTTLLTLARTLDVEPEFLLRPLPGPRRRQPGRPRKM